MTVKPVARTAIAGPTILVAALLCAVAVRDGRADTAVEAAGREMKTWDAGGLDPSRATQAWVRDDLERAQLAVPDDPASHEFLGALAARNLGDPASAGVAFEHFRSALVLRPTSPFTWLLLAKLRYNTGDTGADFERDLRRAVSLGPFEPDVERVVAFLGLAVYDQMSSSTKAVIDQAIVAGARRDAVEMMQISARRGRLDVTCGLVRDIPSGIDPKSSQLCERTGAKL